MNDLRCPAFCRSFTTPKLIHHPPKPSISLQIESRAALQTSIVAPFAAMWDVVWTDPDKELVGERRVRKAKSRNDRHTSLRSRNERHSIATESSLSSQDSPFTLWRSKAKRSAEQPKGNVVPPQPKTPSLSGTGPPSLLSSISPFSKSFEFESRRSSAAVTSAPTSPREDHVSSTGTHHSGSTKRTTVESFPLPQFDGKINSKHSQTVKN